MSGPKYQYLLDRISELEVIDAHEHLVPEATRVKMRIDALSLFSCYTRLSCLAAGMTMRQWEEIHDQAIPLEKRWEAFEHYLPFIRHAAEVRPGFIAVREFGGVEEIGAKTIHRISENLAAGNTPGLYDRILRDKCHIRKGVVVGGEHFEGGDSHFVYLTPLNWEVLRSLDTREALGKRAAELGHPVSSLDDLVALVRWMVEKGAECGNPGIKLFAMPYGPPNRKQAEEVFARLWNGERFIAQHFAGQVDYPLLTPLLGFLVDEAVKRAGELGRVVAVHCGVWGDFRQLNGSHIIPLIGRHPDVRFDLFHASLPYVREAGVMGHNFPNVWLNLTWTHLFSPAMTRSFLDEWMDIVPMNKIIGFGADYAFQVEKVYGHLLMARENIAHVLAGRVAGGLMDAEEAVAVAKMWLFDNPSQLYGIA